MKVLIIAAVILSIIASQACLAAPAPGEALGFKLLKEFYSPDENALLSPYSLYTALSMAAEGAVGETLSQLLTALGTSAPANVAISGAYTANAAFIREDAGVTDEYKRALEKYRAKLFDLDPARIDDINAWASEATDGLIDPLLTEPLNPNAMLVLLNAVSMDAKWRHSFDPSDTRDREFYTPSGTVVVPFLRDTRFIEYSESDICQLAILPYEHDGLNAYIILPPEGEMGAALDRLIDEGYDMFKGLSLVDVKLSIPKLDMTSDVKLSSALKQLGVIGAFSQAADFSGVNDKRDLFISEVSQKAALKLDEDGTRAAAVTQVTMNAKSAMMPEETPELTLDRPFILLIRDDTSAQTLFATCVVNPET